jgi:Icc-related predicted phosphoesterase
MTRIVVTSDTHFAFDDSLIPDGDAFIHCGDLMYNGDPYEWEERLQSLSRLTHKIKIIVPGNHDWYIHNENQRAFDELLQAGVYLLDRTITGVDGLQDHICGLPFVTNLPAWAYNRTNTDILDWLELYNTDPLHNTPLAKIMVTHAPPFGILDALGDSAKKYGLNPDTHVGCKAYREWFDNLKEKPKYWFSGHIHEGYGKMEVDGCTFINAAMCDGNYAQSNPAWVVEI